VEEEFLEHLTGTADYNLQFTRLQGGATQSPVHQPGLTPTTVEGTDTEAATAVALERIGCKRGSYLPLLKRSILAAVTPPPA
jgi:hypothetical protein